QLAELVACHDARAEGVRPILGGGWAHADLPRGHLDVPSREVIEDRDAEQVFSGPRGRDVRTALPQYEANLRDVVHLRGLDGYGRTSLERLESHRRDRVAPPDDVQAVPGGGRGEGIP